MKSLSEIRKQFFVLSCEIFTDTDKPEDIEKFASRYVDADSLVAVWDEQGIVSQIVVIKFKYRDSIPAAYLCYGATRSTDRSRGLYGRVMNTAFEKLRKDGVGVAFIIPASDSLKRYYIERFGFEDNCISSSSDKPLSKALNNKYRLKNHEIDIPFHGNLY